MATESAPESYEGYTLLIVDDNPTNLSVISDYLDEYGFELMVATDGESGLERAIYARPDLILLDVMMPGIDGFEVCHRLKAHDETREIPVIFMTALASVDDKVRGFEAGAVDYVTKPIQQAEVLARVSTHLRIRDLSRAEQKRRVLAESLEETGRILSSSLDMRQVPVRILERLADVVPYERGSVWLRQDNTAKLVAQRGFPEGQQNEELTVALREGDVYHQLIATRQPVIVEDVTKTSAWKQVESLPVNRSWLGVPLITKDNVVGMLSLTRAAAGAFQAEDADLVLMYSAQAAIALENANLYEQITGFNERLERVVQQRTEELENAYKVLEKMDQTKSDFIDVAAHELRTPLTLIKGYAGVLRTMVQNNPEGLQLVEGILNGEDRLLEIVNSLLDVSKISGQVLSVVPTSVNLERILIRVQAEFKAAFQERNLKLELIDLAAAPAIEADPDLLFKVFYHLIGNAIKYTPDGGRISVTATVVGETSALPMLEVVVGDTGIGIDPAYHELIFEKFFQTGKVTYHSSGKTKFKGGGPGLGLAIARGIVKAHGGQIWVESPGFDEMNCPGSRFYVRLPLKNRRIELRGENNNELA